MGKPAIPPYGKDFKLVHLPFVANSPMASRCYEMKSNSTNYVRSTRNSKTWYVFYHNSLVAEHSTMRAAITALRRVVNVHLGE